MNQSKEVAEKLILEVQKRPCIYDHAHPDNKDKNKIEMEWAEIAASLDMTADAVKRRWNNLRGSYSKTLLKNRLRGSAAEPQRFFYLSEQMSFLRQHMAIEKRKGSYDDSEIVPDPATNSEEIFSQYSQPASSPLNSSQPECQPSPTPSGCKKRIRTHEQCDYEPWEQAAVEFFKSRTSPEDPDLAFFKGLLPMIKELETSKKRKYFKDISNLLFDALSEA